MTGSRLAWAVWQDAVSKEKIQETGMQLSVKVQFPVPHIQNKANKTTKNISSLGAFSQAQHGSARSAWALSSKHSCSLG